MEDRAIHELTAAYALDALDEDERIAFEEHLSTCARCREELADLGQTAALLAHGAPSATPPPALRERILAQARSSNGARVIPFPRRPRVALSVAAAITAAAAVLAIAFGVRSASLSNDLDETRAALRILGDPDARSIPLEGADGRLVVDPKGSAALAVRGLQPAPEGKTYELWVIRDDKPRPAGLFEGDDEDDLVVLDEKVDRGAKVAATLEADGGVDEPTGRLLFSASA
jgi:anti-sigma-K factor RskA